MLFWKKNQEETCLLSISVSQDNEIGPIAFEQVIATLHALPSPLSFEIANVEKSIQFYVCVPKRFRKLIEQQIYAHYPDVEIMEAKDYASFPVKKALALELTLIEPDIYPIKRYSQFEDKLLRVAIDPLSGITAALAQVPASGRVAIQIVLRPLPDKWRTVFQNCLTLLSRNIFTNMGKIQTFYTRIYCTRKRRYRLFLWPFYFLFWTWKMQGNKGPSHSSPPDELSQ